LPVFAHSDYSDRLVGFDALYFVRSLVFVQHQSSVLVLIRLLFSASVPVQVYLTE
jgi:hypothetical protein